MAAKWQLQDAKNRLSELIRLVLKEGPQVITIRGEEVAVIVSKEHYDQQRRKPRHLVEAIENSPLKGANIKIERSRELIGKPRFKPS